MKFVDTTALYCVDIANIVWFSAYKLNKIEHKFMIMEVYRNFCEKNSCCIVYSKSYVVGLELIKSVNNSFVCFQSYSEDGKSAAAEKMAQEWRKNYTLIILYCHTVLYLLKEKELKRKNTNWKHFRLHCNIQIMFLLQKCSISKGSNSVTIFLWKVFSTFNTRYHGKALFVFNSIHKSDWIFYFPHGANRKVLRHEARTTLEGRRYRQPPEPEMETVVQNPQFAKFASLYFKEGPCHKLLKKLCKKNFFFVSFSYANFT